MATSLHPPEKGGEPPEAGVPLVAVPFGRDQPEVARRIAECGAGRVLPAKQLTADRLRIEVREAMRGSTDGRDAAARMLASGGPERFADAAVELVSVPHPRALA